MKNYETISAPMAEIMTLKFFAHRFGIKIECLCWAIEKFFIEERTILTPIVSIDGTNLIIDIKKDCLGTKKSLLGRKIEILPATLSQNSKEYVFTTEDSLFLLPKKELKELYAGKILTPEILD